MILNVLSKRNKAPPDTYQYDELPSTLRVVLVNVFRDDVGYRWHRAEKMWEFIAKSIAREHDVYSISKNSFHDGSALEYHKDCLLYIAEATTPHALDLVEVVLRYLDKICRDDHFYHSDPSTVSVDIVLDEVNKRFSMAGFGFQYADGNLVRVDSQILHAEAVKPALLLLSSEKGFSGAHKEFLVAHEHYRHARIEDAVVWASKAFESTMKAICDQRKWTYDKNSATVAKLIQILLSNGLVPAYMQDHLNGLDKCLQGVGTIRNKDGGHGAGTNARLLPPQYAGYALHLAASNILFLIDCHRTLDR